MSSTVRESSHVSRKVVSHGGGHGQIHQNHSSTTANSLENNLDALLEDLQTSVSRSATPVRGVRALSPQVDYKAPVNTTRIVSEGRTISPTRTTKTTTEKFVTSGNSGTVSGIPGLDVIDAELQNVQPGQSKTVAYKQVSYQYKTNVDGSPRDGESWVMSDNVLNTSNAPVIEEIRDRSYDDVQQSKRYRSPERVTNKTTAVNRELLYDTSSTSRSRQTSPLPGSQHRDVSYIQETSNYQIDPRPVQNTVTTIHSNENLISPNDQVEYISIPSPNAAVPINLAPGPNTKVTTTVKTYTYELPGSPENYLPGSSLPRGVVLPGDQTITYTLPRGGTVDKNYSYHTQKVTNTTLPGQTISYQVVAPNDPPTNQIRYASPPPPEVVTKTTSTHKEAKFYREEQHGFPPGSPVQKSVNNTVIYRTGSPPPPVNTETVTTVTRNEKYYQVNGNQPNGEGPRSPANGHPYGPNYGSDPDRPDPSTNTTTIIYQNQPVPKVETRTTVINRSQEYYEGKPYPVESHRHPIPADKNPEPTSHTTVNYYTVAPPQTNPPQTNTTIYKYSNTTTTVPPNKYPDDHEVLLPKPFPTTGVQLYPANANKPPTTPSNGHGPPAKLEDLMASFSDTERDVLADISNNEREQNKVQRSSDLNSQKKEGEIIPHSPPKVQSKNYAGPPVYYPPGSAEFTKKEESGGAMMQSSGGWQKGKAKYEYEASSKSKSKSSSGAAVVPVCLPLCCAMPCVIM